MTREIDEKDIAEIESRWLDSEGFDAAYWMPEVIAALKERLVFKKRLEIHESACFAELFGWKADSPGTPGSAEKGGEAMTAPTMSEEELALKLADTVLDQPWSDPDGPSSVLARQFLRARERLAAAQAESLALRKAVEAVNSWLAVRDAASKLQSGEAKSKGMWEASCLLLVVCDVFVVVGKKEGREK